MDDIGLITADNPGPFTLRGTNTWLVGRNPCFVVDPGPLAEAHLQRILSDAHDRGGIGGIALTHDHLDHVEAVAELRRRAGDVPWPPRATRAPTCAWRTARSSARCARSPLPATPRTTSSTSRAAPASRATPCWAQGSVFVYPDPGALRGYLSALRRLRVMGLRVICPGHGPVVLDAPAKLDEYIAHRMDREQRLVAALDAGLRTADDLLDRVWSDAPSALRPAATVTLTAHLDKLDEEGRLPAGVERPQLSLLGEP